MKAYEFVILILTIYVHTCVITDVTFYNAISDFVMNKTFFYWVF